jgi:hypothetical protein
MSPTITHGPVKADIDQSVNLIEQVTNARGIRDTADVPEGEDVRHASLAYW